jgi:hypothetical protein
MTIPPSITRLMPFLACEGGSIDNAPKVTLTLGEIKAFTESATSSVEVDEDWYQLQYTDVRAAVEKADLSSATEHYQRTDTSRCRACGCPRHHPKCD